MPAPAALGGAAMTIAVVAVSASAAAGGLSKRARVFLLETPSEAPPGRPGLWRPELWRPELWRPDV